MDHKAEIKCFLVATRATTTELCDTFRSVETDQQQQSTVGSCQVKSTPLPSDTHGKVRGGRTKQNSQPFGERRRRPFASATYQSCPTSLFRTLQHRESY
ncbi:hypothetical protein BDN67DRAFT_960726, partial [Paxillus ammoniavirescens]